MSRSFLVLALLVAFAAVDRRVGLFWSQSDTAASPSSHGHAKDGGSRLSVNDH